MPPPPVPPPRAARARRRRAAVAGAVLLVALVLAARLATPADRDVVPPSFTDYRVDVVRPFGVTVYVDTSLGLGDVIVAGVLGLTAAALLAGARAAPDAEVRRTFGDAGLGSLYLAADDLLAVHETLGHNLGALAGRVVTDHPDDLVVGLYALAVGRFLWRHRDLAVGAARRAIAAAVLCGGAAVAHDLLPLQLTALEETLEAVAAAALVVATILVVRGHAPGALRRRAGRAEPVS